MILLETALAVLLVWVLACGSLILGGCISACVLRLASTPVVLYRQAPYPRREKSELYLD